MVLLKKLKQKSHYKFLVISIFFLIIIINSASLAKAKEVTEKNINDNIVYINSSHLKYESDKTILSKGIIIKKEDIIIEAIKGELFREEKKMILKEKIDANYPGIHVNSDFLTAFLDGKEYIFKEKVELDYKISEVKNMILNSGYLKIYGDNNSFIAEQNVKIIYDGQQFKGDKADYDGKNELLNLTGNVKIEEDGDWIKSNKAKFNLKEGESGYIAEGNVEIKMILKD